MDPAGLGGEEGDGAVGQVDGDVLVRVRGCVHGFGLRSVEGRFPHEDFPNGTRGREADFSVPAHDALPAGGGDGEVGDAGGGAGGRGEAVRDEAEVAGDAVEEVIGGGSGAGGEVGGVDGAVFEAESALCSAVESFGGGEEGVVEGVTTFG